MPPLPDSILVNSSGKALKRKRSSASASSAPAPNDSTPATTTSPETGRVRVQGGIESLKWKKVRLPDRLDDMEGLMGLEEIDGVDIEMEEIGGGAKKLNLFMKAAKKAEEKKQAKEAKKEKKGDKAVEKEEGGEEQDRETVDEASAPAAEEEEAASAPKPKKQKKKKEKKDKKPKTPAVAEALATEESTFAGLDESEDDVDLPGWSEFSFSQPLRRALHSFNFSAPTDIQELALPHLLSGRDLIGKAATGSGKTLAFALPIIEHIISTGARDKTQALILAPTRELAHQIAKAVEGLAKFSAVNVITVTGGLAVQKQQRLLAKNPDIVVATPGRLYEVMRDGHGLIAALKGIKFLVLDEADRLLQEGHFKEVEEILELIGGGEESDGRQTLVFSATFQKDLQQKLGSKKGFKLKNKKFSDAKVMDNKDTMAYLLHRLKFREDAPEFVDANPDDAVAKKIHEGIIECGSQEKDLYLYYFLLRYPGRTLVFVNNIDAVRRIHNLLSELGVHIVRLDSNLMQKQRLNALERFKATDKCVMIASDVAARGLDIPGVQHVIHYHLPRAADMYVHRSGRTARGAGNEGVAIILCAPDEVGNLRKMIAKLDKNVEEMATFPIDRQLVAKLKPRITLAKKITEGDKAQSKKGHEDAWLKQAAEDLGVDIDEAISVPDKKINSKSARAGMKAELAELLKQPVRGGFSTKYLTSGEVNLAQQLLDGKSHSMFLGKDVSTALGDIPRKKKE
ncbi:ATP-dependent RNA helicase [Saitoella coloradoensis]